MCCNDDDNGDDGDDDDDDDNDDGDLFCDCSITIFIHGLEKLFKSSFFAHELLRKSILILSTINVVKSARASKHKCLIVCNLKGEASIEISIHFMEELFYLFPGILFLMLML